MHVACGARADGGMQRWCYLVTSGGSGRDCCRLDLGAVSFDCRALLHDFALELAARGDGAILVRERIDRLLLRRFQRRAVLHSRRRCQLLLLDDRRVSRGDFLVALGDCRRVIGGRRRVSGDRRDVLGDRRVALGDRRVALVDLIDRPRVDLHLVGELLVFRRELSAESGNLGGAIGELRVALRYRRRLRRDRPVTLGDGSIALGGGVCDNTKAICVMICRGCPQTLPTTLAAHRSHVTRRTLHASELIAQRFALVVTVGGCDERAIERETRGVES